MSKIIRLNYYRCDHENYVKLESKDRYALLLYATICKEPDESIDEVVEYFTSEILCYRDDDPDDIVALDGGRFTKKGLKELRQWMYALRDELLNEEPNRVTDGISGIDPDVPGVNHDVDKH